MIINKDNIILASDFAVTTPENKPYVYCSKIYRLNKDSDVGVMINGKIDFENISLESLISEFGKTVKFTTIENVKNDFIKYLSENMQSSTLEEYLKPILENFKIELENKIMKYGFDEMINYYRQNKLNSYFESYKNFKYEFYDIIPDNKNKSKYNLEIWKIFSRQFEYEGTGVIFAGFDEGKFHPSFSEISIYHNNNGKIIHDEIESKVNCEEADIKVFAMNEEAYAFLTGVSNDFEVYMEEHVKKIKNKFIQCFKKELNNEDYSSKQINNIIYDCNVLLDTLLSNLSEISKNYKLGSLKDISTASQYLPNTIQWDLADQLIKITSLKQKYSSEIETVSSETEIVHISKKDGLRWVKKENDNFK